ncbi:MAG: Crp/Fnr family transcriptional regulator, partial [Nitrospiraceae bacterium]|nr:Crp/Fnr family transcriptional regulator [Nitrospiraceae bacterium]
IDNRTTPAMVVSMEDSIIAIIARETFRQLLHTQGKMLDVMLRILCDRLRASWDRIQILSFSSASQRIRMLLHVLSDEHGQKVKNGTMLNVKLTHQDIANMTGIARETVTRILDKLSRDGEVTVLKNKVFVLNDRFTERSLEC